MAIIKGLYLGNIDCFGIVKKIININDIMYFISCFFIIIIVIYYCYILLLYII